MRPKQKQLDKDVFVDRYTATKTRTLERKGGPASKLLPTRSPRPRLTSLLRIELLAAVRALELASGADTDLSVNAGCSDAVPPEKPMNLQGLVTTMAPKP